MDIYDEGDKPSETGIYVCRVGSEYMVGFAFSGETWADDPETAKTYAAEYVRELQASLCHELRAALERVKAENRTLSIEQAHSVRDDIYQATIARAENAELRRSKDRLTAQAQKEGDAMHALRFRRVRDEVRADNAEAEARSLRARLDAMLAACDAETAGHYDVEVGSTEEAVAEACDRIRAAGQPKGGDDDPA